MLDKETFRTIKEFLRKAGALMLALFLALGTVPSFAVMAEEPGDGSNEEREPQEFHTRDESRSFSLLVEGIVEIDGGPNYKTGYEGGVKVYSERIDLGESYEKTPEALAFESTVQNGMDAIAESYSNNAKSANLEQSSENDGSAISGLWSEKYVCVEVDGELVFSNGKSIYCPASDFGAALGDTLRVDRISTVGKETETFYLKGTVEPYTIQMLADGEGGAVETDLAYALANDEVTITATPNEGYEFDEWEILEGPELEFDKTAAESTFKMPNADLKLQANFKEKEQEEIPVLDKEVTLHFSSVEGDDLVSAIVVAASEDMTIDDALQAANMSLDDDFFELDGFVRVGANPTLKSFREYEDMPEVYADEVTGDELIEDDMDLYVPMAKVINKIELKIEAPLCGQEVIIHNGLAPWLGQEGGPNMATADDHYSFIAEMLPFWTADQEADDPLDYFIKGGKEYTAFTPVQADFGYAFAPDADISVIGGEIGDDTAVGKDFATISVIVTAEHDWSEWKVAKKPTAYEEGIEHRVCSGCGEEETRTLEKISYRNTMGDGNVWNKGSADVSSFEFKRSENDETTYGRFVKAQVDGKEIDPSNYAIAQGSLFIDLKPAYLETLAVGEHTLTVFFNDGESSASFKIAEKPAPAPSPDKSDKSDTPSESVKPADNAKKTNANTGDSNNIVFWVFMFLGAVMLAGCTLGYRSILLKEQE